MIAMSNAIKNKIDCLFTQDILNNTVYNVAIIAGVNAVSANIIMPPGKKES